MPATLIDGKALALKVRAEVAADVAAFGEPVCLATILVGEDPARTSTSKHKACTRRGSSRATIASPPTRPRARSWSWSRS